MACTTREALMGQKLRPVHVVLIPHRVAIGGPARHIKKQTIYICREGLWQTLEAVCRKGRGRF